MITIGIDPHKRSLTAVALDPHSRLLSQLRVPTTGQAAQQLLAWAAAWPERRWAVEGATGLGRGIAQLLVAAGEPVLDVPAKLAARARLLGTSSARKTDLADAASVAAAAIHHRRLRPVALEDQTVILRLLSDRRDDLVAERTRTLSRLHVLLADLQPGGANRERSATRAAAVLRQVRPITAVDIERKRIARDLLADVGRLDRQVKTASQTIRTAVREHGTTLTEVYGVGPVLAAKLLGHTGDITRFPDRDHFASYSGTAPVEASSGDVRRHRLNRAGNRQLNTALHLIAVCQIRDPSPGQVYYQRKLVEAKTPEEARRSLKRHLANVVYRHLIADHHCRIRAS
ncbi:MAG TPA: IS110 family transposase [Propionibacteriaceae bacterium]|nr:IS110 family transposase [Propionibacteriaceae bacterium]